MADAVGTVAGSMLGTSTITSFVESSSGVAEGGKTGLTRNDYWSFVHRGSVPVSDFPGNPKLCHCACADHRRFLHGIFY